MADCETYFCYCWLISAFRWAEVVIAGLRLAAHVSVSSSQITPGEPSQP